MENAHNWTETKSKRCELVFLYQQRFMGPEGFIQDPSTKGTKRFQRDKKSRTRDQKVFVDAGLPMSGKPALLKTRVQLRRDAAEHLWRVLHRVA